MAPRSFRVWHCTRSRAERGKYAQNICCVDGGDHCGDYYKAIVRMHAQSKRNVLFNNFDLLINSRRFVRLTDLKSSDII